MALRDNGFRRVSELLTMSGLGGVANNYSSTRVPALPDNVVWRQLSRPLAAGLGRRGILIVDENAMLENAAATLLEKQGYHMHLADTFGKGEIALRGPSFDLVIVDQGSPRFEGRAVVQQAIAMDRYRPVLVAARCVNMRCYLDAMSLGATDYVEAPRSADQLIAMIRKFMTRASAA
jgi:DNA-binding NtrC family response regulator